MSGIRVHLTWADPVSVEAAADEMKARFGSRFAATVRSRHKDGRLPLRSVILVDAADPLDAAATDLLRRPLSTDRDALGWAGIHNFCG